jgi:hypothetical protein
MSELKSQIIATGTRINLRLTTFLLATMCFVFLTQVPYLYFICNYNDCGYFLTNQDLANHLGIHHVKVVPWWWFSDIVGGFWLRLSEDYGLWGAKLGGALAVAFAGTYSARTLSLVYKPNFILFLAMVFTGLCIQNEMLNYISVPTLFYAVFCYYFLKMNLKPSSHLYSIVSGITFALTIFSRMPLIFGLVVPLLCLLFCYRMKREQFATYLNSYLKMYVTIFGCFLFFVLYLYSEGLLSHYFAPAAPSKDHTIFSLLYLVSNQLIGKIPVLLAIGTSSIALFYLIKRGWLSSRVASYTFIAFLGANFSLAILSLKNPYYKEFAKVVWPDSFDIYPILIACIFVCLPLMKDRIDFREIVLITLAISWPFLRTLGSAIGLEWGIVIGFLLCGVAVVLLTRIANTYRCRTSLFCLTATLALIIGGKSAKYLLNSLDLTMKNSSYAQADKMEGVSAILAFGEDLASLVREMKGYAKKSDQILAGPYISLVYFASGTLPLGNHSSFYFLDIPQFSNKLDEIAKMSPPKLIVRPKIDFQNPLDQEQKFCWPINSDFLDDLMLKCAIFDEKIVKRWGAKIVWSNNSYDLYILSDSFKINE